jgi:hypothetical protein
MIARSLPMLRVTAAIAALLAAGAPHPARCSDGDPPASVSDPASASGRIGVGFYGVQAFTFPGAPGAQTASVPFATIGARYWLPGGGGGLARAIGIDLGAGVGFAGGSVRDASGVTSDLPSQSAFGLHLGLPLAVAEWRHAAFVVVPELTFVRAVATTRAAGLPDTHLTGNAYDVGARAGLEVFFGFIGVPQLSVEMTLGLGFTYVRATARAGDGPETAASAFFSGTAVFNDPFSYRSSFAPLSLGGGWAAHYYF